VRCTPDMGDLLHPLEEVICTKLLPNLTGQSAFNDVYCLHLLDLAVRVLLIHLIIHLPSLPPLLASLLLLWT